MDNRKIKTNDVVEFLHKAEINWVIVNPNGKPVCWPDGNVKVFSCIDDLMTEYDATKQSIMTEFAFIQQALDLWTYDDYVEMINA